MTDATAPAPDEGAAWMSFGQPGPEHARLAAYAGEWRQRNSIWPFPGAPEMVFDSTSSFTPIFGGRYLHQRMQGGMEMQGLTVEFAGEGWFGFDNFRQRHVFVWIDNSTTMVMQGDGAVDEQGRIVYEGALPDPVAGGLVPFRAILWKEGEDRFIFDNLGRMPDGSWHLKMRAVSTRA